MTPNGHYQEPNHEEEYRQRTAILLRYVLLELEESVSTQLQKDCGNIYCNTDHTEELRRILNGLPNQTLEAIAYNARSRDSRRLADWWEREQALDRAMKERREERRKRETLIESAKKKLSEVEIQAIGLKERGGRR